MNHIEVMKKIVDAIEADLYSFNIPLTARMSEAIRAGRQCVEEAEKQEPVAWIRGSGMELLKLENGGAATVYACAGMSNHSTALYTSPPQPSQSIDYEWAVKEMLAIIHGDGGQYTEEQGLKKSIEDAHKKLSNYYATQKVDKQAEIMKWQEGEYDSPSIAMLQTAAAENELRFIKFAEWLINKFKSEALNLPITELHQPKQSEQEPVAWIGYDGSEGGKWLFESDEPDPKLKLAYEFEPVYSAPPPSKPMTDEKIGSVLSAFPKCASNWAECDFYDFARAIEAAKD